MCVPYHVSEERPVYYWKFFCAFGHHLRIRNTNSFIVIFVSFDVVSHGNGINPIFGHIRFMFFNFTIMVCTSYRKAMYCVLGNLSIRTPSVLHQSDSCHGDAGYF